MPPTSLATSFHFPQFLDYLAVFLWATTGAILAMRRGYDVVGVFFVALVSATGGSILRDGLFLQQTPPVVSDPWYGPLVLLATLNVGLFGRRLAQDEGLDKLVALIDAIGTPAFAVTGVQLSLAAGLTVSGALLVGALNGIGGGLMRDLLVGEAPTLFRPGQFYAVVVAVALGLYVGLTRVLGLDATGAAWLTIVVFFVIRALTIRFNWRTTALADWKRLAREAETRR